MENKKKKKPFGIVRWLSTIGAGGVIGFFIGFGGVVFAEKIIPDDPSYKFLSYGVVVVSLLISLFLHIIIHESGHLVFGKMSGYKFVSFRIFIIMLIKENGKLVRKKFNIVGTGGQCLMMPPEPVDGRYPYVLYHLGGSLMNFAFSGIVLVLCIMLYGISSLFVLAAFPFVIMGVFTGLLNILPLKMNGVATDGYNALTLGGNETARCALWLALHINALTVSGVRYRDMPAEWFDLLDETGLNDPIAVTHAIERFNYLFDNLRFDEARELAEHLLNTVEKMLEVHKNELRCELLFLEIIGECRKDELDRLYTKELKKYIKATSSYVSRQRLLYAYAKLVTLDNTEAEKVIKQFEKVCGSYPNAGEINSERDMIVVIDNAAKKNENE